VSRGRSKPIGTEHTSANGYLYRKTEYGWVLVHRLIAEEKIGRRLLPNEYATFNDGNRTNFDPSNIVIKLRGRTSIRRRLASIEDQIRELTTLRDDLRKRIKAQEEL
jgi:hypothetical protein